MVSSTYNLHLASGCYSDEKEDKSDGRRYNSKSRRCNSDIEEDCQVRVYSGRGSGQVRTKADEGREQGAGQGVSPAGVGDRLDSMTKDNER